MPVFSRHIARKLSTADSPKLNKLFHVMIFCEQIIIFSARVFLVTMIDAS
jgi:hypothetical protein